MSSGMGWVNGLSPLCCCLNQMGLISLEQKEFCWGK